MRFIDMPVAVVVAFLSGCSTHHSDRDLVDAGVTGHLSFVSGCAEPGSSLTFAQATPTQRATAVAFAINDGDTDVTLGGDLRQIAGPDAADFSAAESLDSEYCSFPVYYSAYAPRNCCPQAVLSPGAWCQLVFEFHPSTLGEKHATYVIAAGAGTLELGGTSVETPASFHADRVNIAHGYIPTNPVPRPSRGSSVSFQLINDSTAPVEIGNVMIDSPFTASLDTSCPSPLTPGGACSGSVSLPEASPRIPECQTVMLTSSTSSLSVPVTFTPPPAPMETYFYVQTIGSGGGTVTSTSIPFNCVAGGDPAACGYVSWKPPATVDLTATATEGSELIGWFLFPGTVLSACGKSATCTVDAPPPSLFEPVGSTLQAWFAPTSDPHVNLTIVGTGTVTTGSATFDRSWTYSAQQGTAGTSLSPLSGAFVGWSGDCSGTGDCNLGTIINDRNVTATFNP